MEGDFSRVYAVHCGCKPSPLEPACHIPLPHGSPLGHYQGALFQPTAEAWPATFVCLRHGLVKVWWPDEIRLDLETRAPGKTPTAMWQIKCKCVHDGCGRRHIVYAAGASWGQVWRRILKRRPRVRCGDHDLQWRKDLMRGTMFEHDLPSEQDRVPGVPLPAWAIQRSVANS